MADAPPPAELHWLVQLIGLDATIRLITEHGGTRIALPRTIGPGRKLALVVGEAAARRLVDHLGHTRLWKVPNCKRWRAQLLRAQGRTHREIALALGMDESSVGRHLARGRT